MKFAVYLPDQFSMLSFSAVIEPIHAFNTNFSEDDIALLFVGRADKVRSDSGVVIDVLPDAQTDGGDVDHWLIVGGRSEVPEILDHLHVVCDRLKQWATDHPDGWIGGVASGAVALASSGLLKGCTASVQGRDIRQLSERFPEVRFSTDLFSLDGRRMTCRAGSAALDMMIFWLGRRYGVDVAEALSKYFVQLRLGTSAPVRIKQLSEAEKNEQPRLAEVIELMESNLEEPLSTDDLAYHVNISRRQLERLFKKYLDNVPSRYYLQIRLEEARRLLQSTGLTISEIAIHCGFSSGAHFSTSYRNFFGISPKEERTAGR